MRGKEWSQRHKDFLKQNYGKLTAGVIGERIGRSATAVHKEAAKLGLRSGLDKSTQFAAAKVSKFKLR